MIKGIFPVEKFKQLDTPFYYYDTELLRATLQAIKKETENKPFHVHYAVKANANPLILKEISAFGFGADCVSGNEILAAMESGFTPDKIVFAGVGKSDREIEIGLDNDIFCFNVESIPELEVLNTLASAKGKTARVAFRINPNVDAHTHKYITTGLTENKFGINEQDLPRILGVMKDSSNLQLTGIHFHIGSQITDLKSFEDLCVRVKELQEWFNTQGIKLPIINVGGGLGINYQHPNHIPMADFESYFRLFEKNLQLQPNQELHFELGRAVVAPCGSLISRVLFVKEGIQKKFLIVDAGMTDLIRPALYQAFHHIENISSDKEPALYDVVGPICESSDVFAEQIMLNESARGDLIAIRSAGAYGEVMASRYNCRNLPLSYFSDQL
ncbi:diaminopimelate decarboxylase [Porphyromonadaceae bacterium KH3R12]|uniref:diaminopimelate decarboxylase n=1 Tax=Proteiniphilum sp. TaxID=1926877 RepID=UPI0008983084|nr:diaminopimelate decarboxylase [Proteiniphilum sp.]MDY9917345.1 diaminopimelate decarboxylase [Proteiniphilum sp.]SDZ81854.1 diaminopimelate decarboxylase [Porphyromonadaceae bacterium KH3R12]